MPDDPMPPTPDAPAGDAPTPTDTPADTDAPQVPEKFLKEDGSVNTDALLKSYTALEQKQSAANATAQGPDALALPRDEPIDDNASVDEIVRAAGLEPNDVGRQFMEKGNLTAAQYKAFKAKGIPRGIIDQYMKMQAQVYRAAQAKLVAEASELAGGDKQRDTILLWAKDNLSQEDRAFYDVQAMNPDTAIRGFEWLLAKHARAVGAGDAQPLITGDGAATPTGGYTSQSEWLKANNDPRYETDRAYRMAVDARADKTDVRIIHGMTPT